VRIPKALVEVPSRTLDFPRILYRDPDQQHEIQKSVGNSSRWSLKGNHFLINGITHNLRPYLLTSTGYKYRGTLALAKTYGQHIRDQLEKQNLITLADSDFCHVQLPGVDRASLDNALASVREDALASGNHALSDVVVFLLLPKKNIQIYQFFKDLADRNFGLHPICTMEAPNYHSKTIPKGPGKSGVYKRGDEKALVQYFGNIMIKVNCT
jgi:hypothetical protein